MTLQTAADRCSKSYASITTADRARRKLDPEMALGIGLVHRTDGRFSMVAANVSGPEMTYLIHNGVSVVSVTD